MRTLGLSRFQLKYAVGGLPHEQRMESIRLYGTQVVPRVRELLGVEPAPSGLSDAAQSSSPAPRLRGRVP